MKALLITTLTTLSLLVLAVPVFGQTDAICSETTGNGEVPDFCQEQTGETPFTGDSGILTNSINIITIMVVTGAVFVVIISGYQFTTGGSDPARVAKARTNLIYALVGVVVAVFARAIVFFALDSL